MLNHAEVIQEIRPIKCLSLLKLALAGVCEDTRAAMKAWTTLLLPLLWLSCARGQAVMHAASVLVSCYSEAGMTPLGSISMKVQYHSSCLATINSY